MNKILILSNQSTDLSDLLLANCPGSVLQKVDAHTDLSAFEAVAILGGCEEERMMLPAELRLRVEEAGKAGKPVFTEYVSSIGLAFAGEPLPKIHHRPVYVGDNQIPGLTTGDVFDAHENECLPLYYFPEDAVPLLTYHDYVCAHDHIEVTEDMRKNGQNALWMQANHTLVCAFRLCNFRRARFAPEASWQAVLTYILSHLAGEPVSPVFFPPVCSFHKTTLRTPEDVAVSVQDGLRWFADAGILRENGIGGADEGYSHRINARNGEQVQLHHVRGDCTGETAGAFLWDWLLTGSEESHARFVALQDFLYNYMQVKEGPHHGMVRWSEQSWTTCYQDDVARAILPTLLCQKFAPEKNCHFDDAAAACDYIARTSSKDGLRLFRTDIIYYQTQASVDALRDTEEGYPSVHYNGYSLAVLLLCAQCTGNREMAELAERGMTVLMKLYPETTRETSETEELCRLLLPLSILYETTGKEEHRAWLYRVAKDLERFRHPSGGYQEWDTGYRANCSRREAGECALLAANGDPVADLLYSNNWLPLAFAYAYHVTGDSYFYDRWMDNTSFLVSCQVHAASPHLDGSWARALDMNRFEIYGVPHDIGWAPCCIESGWTVGEILAGMQFMQWLVRHPEHIAKA